MASQPPPLPQRRTFQVPQLPAGRGGIAPGSGTGADSRFAPGVTRRSGRDQGRGTPEHLGTAMGGTTYGVWIAFSSTNVYAGMYEPDYETRGGDSVRTGKGTITLEFLDGSKYEYPGRSAADWLDIISSSSKGRYAFYNIRGPGPSHKGMGIWTFRQVSGPTRSKAEVARMRAQREPTTAKQRQRTYISRGKVVRLGPSIH